MAVFPQSDNKNSDESNRFDRAKDSIQFNLAVEPHGKERGRLNRTSPFSTSVTANFGGLKPRGQLRHGVEQVSNQTVVCNLEDWCFFILVDRHDDLGVLHTGKMLDRTGNTRSNV